MNICLVFIFVSVATGAVVQAGPLPNMGGANYDRPEVLAILEEINELMRDHYNIPRPAFKRQPTAEEIEEENMLDDIRLSVEQAQDILDGLKRRWGYKTSEDRIVVDPNNTLRWDFPIKFGFNGQHSPEEQDIIRAGFKLWEDATCVTFEEHDLANLTGSGPHLRIIEDPNGCYSEVGCVNKTHGQDLSIGQERCMQVGTVSHEAAHALGMYHEFSRPDRDDHVNIIWGNIRDGKQYNFDMHPDYDPADTGYDINSVMHYNSLGFSTDPDAKARVIMPLDLYQLGAMGQRVGPSFNDFKRINYAYDCISKLCSPDELNKPCQNGGYQNPKSCRVCNCPPGLGGDDCSEIASAVGDGMTGCGGDLEIPECSIKTIHLPQFPEAYSENAGCTWKIKTSAKGLVFAFQDQPDMPCSDPDFCYDFVEIRSDMTALDSPGRFFCQCGESKGRVVTVDNQGEVLVRFGSIPTARGGGALFNSGFLLNAYATCNDTLASELLTSCRITSTNYESCSGVPVPQCYANSTDFVEPIPTTPAPTTPPPSTTTSDGVRNSGSMAIAIAGFWLKQSF